MQGGWGADVGDRAGLLQGGPCVRHGTVPDAGQLGNSSTGGHTTDGDWAGPACPCSIFLLSGFGTLQVGFILYIANINFFLPFKINISDIVTNSVINKR